MYSYRGERVKRMLTSRQLNFVAYSKTACNLHTYFVFFFALYAVVYRNDEIVTSSCGYKCVYCGESVRVNTPYVFEKLGLLMSRKLQILNTRVDTRTLHPPKDGQKSLKYMISKLWFKDDL